MNNQLLFGVAIVPTIVALTQIARQVGLPSQFAPLVALALGPLAGLAQVYAAHYSWIQVVVVGIALGLSAVGLHAGVTAVAPAVTAHKRRKPPVTHSHDTYHPRPKKPSPAPPPTKLKVAKNATGLTPATFPPIRNFEVPAAQGSEPTAPDPEPVRPEPPRGRPFAMPARDLPPLDPPSDGAKSVQKPRIPKKS